MRNRKDPAFLPVDSRAIYPTQRSKTTAVQVAIEPWPVRRRIGVFVALALAAWIVTLSPILLIN
jgi:hypothetical protein